MNIGNKIRPDNQSWRSLIFFLLVCLGAGYLGSLMTDLSVRDWYLTLRKPAWTPPGWVFGPVWTMLYIMMAIAGWLVWRLRIKRDIRQALIFFFVQLLLNVGWSGLFFGLQNPGAAFREIIVLWMAILATLVFFWRVRPLAGMLLVPYQLWVTFAAILNLAIWQMNV
jgi:tryptophan-rich sensory protein